MRTGIVSCACNSMCPRLCILELKGQTAIIDCRANSRRAIPYICTVSFIANLYDIGCRDIDTSFKVVPDTLSTINIHVVILDPLVRRTRGVSRYM